MRTVLIVLTFFGFLSCARSVSRISPDQSIDLSGRWNDTDSGQVANKMIADLMGSEKFKDYAKSLGKKPAIVLGLIRNQTSEHIASYNYVREFELAIFS